MSEKNYLPRDMQCPGQRARVASFGSVVARFAPAESRAFPYVNTFHGHIGGAEFNVVATLSGVFNLPTFFATTIYDDMLGEFLWHQMGARRVNLDYVNRVPVGSTDPIRNPLLFVDRGEGHRPPESVSDRLFEAASYMKPGDTDWARLLRDRKISWLHTGGVFLGVGKNALPYTLDAIAAAKASPSTIGISFDLNYRHSLYQAHGGVAAARRNNRQVVPEVDYLFGGIGDFERALLDDDPVKRKEEISLEEGKEILRRVAERYPNLKLVAATLRKVIHANLHELAALVYHEGEVLEIEYKPIQVRDRIGSGDAFVAAFLWGALMCEELAYTLKLAWAAADLASTTDGDLLEVQKRLVVELANGRDATIRR